MPNGRPPWADIDKPIWLDLPDNWGDILERYEWLEPSPPLAWIFEHVSFELGATKALIERYLDADYRDEYQQFYALTFTTPADRCERLHFWGSPRLSVVRFSDS